MTDRVPADQAPADVYVIRSAAGEVLYVGVTRDINRRMSVHKCLSGWWRADMAITTERFERRLAAEHREAELIAELKPSYNRHLPNVALLAAQVAGDPAAAYAAQQAATRPDPIRDAGQHGQVWDDCAAQAVADNQTMTDFVRDAITRELDRRRSIIRLPSTGPAVTTTVWTGPPDHPGRGSLPLYEGPPLAAAPQCPACTSPNPHHRFALADPDGDGPAWCDHEWHDADAVTSGTYTRPEMLSDRLGYPPQVGDEDWARRSRPADVAVIAHPDGTVVDITPAVRGYTTPGARHCRCEYLGAGTPEHDASALCVSLRPDADRDPEQAYPVRRCGQQSAHGPHVVDTGPDQPRNCPGMSALSAYVASELSPEALADRAVYGNRSVPDGPRGVLGQPSLTADPQHHADD